MQERQLCRTNAQSAAYRQREERSPDERLGCSHRELNRSLVPEAGIRTFRGYVTANGSNGTVKPRLCCSPESPNPASSVARCGTSVKLKLRPRPPCVQAALPGARIYPGLRRRRSGPRPAGRSGTSGCSAGWRCTPCIIARSGGSLGRPRFAESAPATLARRSSLHPCGSRGERFAEARAAHRHGVRRLRSHARGVPASGWAAGFGRIASITAPFSVPALLKAGSRPPFSPPSPASAPSPSWARRCCRS